ncbi:hypothetical protein NL459_29255, partial [Klebsiella pneumoniae]|nr:hypothetical protein [Klebsiella pneumoniae]
RAATATASLGRGILARGLGLRRLGFGRRRLGRLALTGLQGIEEGDRSAFPRVGTAVLAGHRLTLAPATPERFEQIGGL